MSIIIMDRIDHSGYIGAAAAEADDEKEEDENNWRSSSSTSSIGRNSDLDENEVQSFYKGPFLIMDSLEEALPIRRGISNFYNGKSKSFTSLAEASSSTSLKDIAKQENAYTRRRRRNLLANRCSPLRNISKRPITCSPSSLALALAISSSDSSITSTSTSTSEEDSRSPPPTRLPPLHPQSWRSYSLADLQQCTAHKTSNSHSSLSHKTESNL